MNRPLHDGAARGPAQRPHDGHAGLWFDKFCNQWKVRGSSWTLESGKDSDKGRSKPEGDGRKGDDREKSPKLKWLDTVTGGRVGAEHRIGELASRMARLVKKRRGRFSVFTSESRFVTGLGRSHPVENGFAWHPTLGTPYLPGSSIKGAVRAWTKLDADPSIPSDRVKRLLGDADAKASGSICFLDAVPMAPVQLESDVMTPHHAGWTEKEPPGDWRSPVPIPFLVTSAGTPFLFGILPRGTVSDHDLDVVMSWLCSAFAECGGGAKTAVGYGRFARDGGRTAELEQRLQTQELEHQKRIQKEQEAAALAARQATMDPIEREIEEILEGRPDKNEPEVTTIIRYAAKGHWSGSDLTEVAKWLERRMKAGKRWREKSSARKPSKDRSHQDTLRVKGWLEGRASREGGC